MTETSTSENSIVDTWFVIKCKGSFGISSLFWNDELVVQGSPVESRSLPARFPGTSAYAKRRGHDPSGL